MCRRGGSAAVHADVGQNRGSAGSDLVHRFIAHPFTTHSLEKSVMFTNVPIASDLDLKDFLVSAFVNSGDCSRRLCGMQV